VTEGGAGPAAGKKRLEFLTGGIPDLRAASPNEGGDVCNVTLSQLFARD